MTQCVQCDDLVRRRYRRRLLLAAVMLIATTAVVAAIQLIPNQNFLVSFQAQCRKRDWQFPIHVPISNVPSVQPKSPDDELNFQDYLQPMASN